MEPMILRPTPKQREARKLADNNLITLYGGAIRGGKTYWLILMLWTLAKKYPNSRWVIIRASYATLQQTTMVSFQSLMDLGLQIDVEKFNQQTHTVTLYNGSQIIFMAESYDMDKELNRFKGLEINGGAFDEINEVQEVTFNKVIERAGSWQHSPGCPIRIIASCNPTRGWVKEKFYDRWENGTLPKRWAYIPAKITDNPHISEEYRESLKELPRYEYEVFVEGNWNISLKTGGEFWKQFVLDKHVKPVIVEKSTIHVSFDENVTPYVTITAWQIIGKNIRQVQEILCTSPDNNAPKAAKKLAEWLKSIGYKDVLYIYGDPSSGKRSTVDENNESFYDKVISVLKAEGFVVSSRVGKSAPEVALSAAFINEIYESQLNGYSITIGEHCKKSIDDYVSVKEDKDGSMMKPKVKDPVTEVTYEKQGHISDSKRYFIITLLNTDFIIYKTRRKKYFGYSS